MTQGTIRGLFCGLRFSESLILLIVCNLHSHKKTVNENILKLLLVSETMLMPRLI